MKNFIVLICTFYCLATYSQVAAPVGIPIGNRIGDTAWIFQNIDTFMVQRLLADPNGYEGRYVILNQDGNGFKFGSLTTDATGRLSWRNAKGPIPTSETAKAVLDFGTSGATAGESGQVINLYRNGNIRAGIGIPDNIFTYYSSNDGVGRIDFGAISQVNGTTVSRGMTFEVVRRRLGIGTQSPAFTIDLGGSDGIGIPAGTAGGRSLTPRDGYIRYNTTIDRFEAYSEDVGGFKTIPWDTDITTPLSGSGPPAVAPRANGDRYFDYTNSKWYSAWDNEDGDGTGDGLDADDWVILN